MNQKLLDWTIRDPTDSQKYLITEKVDYQKQSEQEGQTNRKNVNVDSPQENESHPP